MTLFALLVFDELAALIDNGWKRAQPRPGNASRVRLTLVAQPCAEIGRRAAFLLMERIAAPEGARRKIRLDAALVERDSCGPPR